MQNQRGFVGIGVLIAILIGLAVLGGGTYYVVQQQSPSQIATDIFNDVQTSPVIESRHIAKTGTPTVSNFGQTHAALTEKEILTARYIIGYGRPGSTDLAREIIFPANTQNNGLLTGTVGIKNELFWIYKYEFTDSAHTQAKVYIGGNFGASADDDRIFTASKVNGKIITNETPMTKNTVSNQPSNTQTTPSVTTPISNNTITWKTYKNSKYSFEFQYPSYLGDVVVMESNPNDCPEMKTYAPFGVIEGKNLWLSFSKKASIGSGGSYMEYYIHVVQKDKSDATVCGINLVNLRSNIGTDTRYRSSPLQQSNSVETYKSSISTSLGTSAERFYTLFNTSGTNVTVVQPRAIFIPYANSVEWAEINAIEKSGNQQAIVSFVNASEKANKIREYLNDFEKIVQSIKFSGPTVSSPKINSVSPSVVSVGSTIVVNGSGFSYSADVSGYGMQATRDAVRVMMTHSHGIPVPVASVLMGNNTSDTLITFSLPARVCSASERGCADDESDPYWVKVVPGSYSMYVVNPHTGAESNRVYVTVQ